MSYYDDGGCAEYDRMMEEQDFEYFGNARRCPRHPHVKTSSDDGMFDAPCYECEAAMEQEETDDRERRVNEAVATMATSEWRAERERRRTEPVLVDIDNDDIPF